MRTLKYLLFEKLVFTVVLLFSFSFLLPAQEAKNTILSDVFPGETWERYEEPELAGYSKEKLEEARKYIETQGTTGMIVAVDGRILFEYGDIEELFYVASVRKSVLAMLFGNYVENGTIDLNKSLAELGIDDIGGLSEQEKEATIADLLSARSGVYHAASNSGDNLADAPERGSKKHGEYFLYSNWDFNALGTIFEQETGKSIYDALEEDIVIPIGMRDFNRSTHRRTGDSKKSIHLAYHMVFSTRDIARLGHLMLHKGRWENNQVIPKNWAEKITSVITPNSEMNPPSVRSGPFGYGYLWWVFDGPQTTWPLEGAYSARGHGGQYITVIPALTMVIAHKTNFSKNGNNMVSLSEYGRIFEKILQARITE